MASTTGVKYFTKNVTAIADNTATAVLTVAIPNQNLRAQVMVQLVGSLGAGGAVGVNEATGTVSYNIGIAKRTGVAAVVTAGTAYGSGMASLAGAATITVTAAASSIAGGTGANTFTVNVTIAKGSGSSDNHTCDVLAQVFDPGLKGVTVS